MVVETARQAIIKQLSYALAVQTLAEQNSIPDPELLITSKYRTTTSQAAEHLIGEFERSSLLDEVKRLTDGHGFWYPVFQGVIAAFGYSVFLVVAALVLRMFGIDIITMLLHAGSSIPTATP
jgi:hypothetical protein